MSPAGSVHLVARRATSSAPTSRGSCGPTASRRLRELTRTLGRRHRVVLGRRRPRPRHRVLDALRARPRPSSADPSGPPGSSAAGRTSPANAWIAGPSAPPTRWPSSGKARTARCARRRTRALQGDDRRARDDAASSSGSASGDTVALFLPMAIETVAARHGLLEDRRDLGADLQRVRPRRRGRAHRRREVRGRDHRERDRSARAAVVPMKPVADRAAEIAGGVRHVVVWDRLPDESTASSDGATSRGPTPGRGRAARSMPSRSTASTRCSSDTRAARPAGPRARCTCTAASS